MDNAKPFWQSKELIVAGVALGAGWIQSQKGWIISPEYQGYIVIVVMAILRAFFTQGPVTLK